MKKGTRHRGKGILHRTIIHRKTAPKPYAKLPWKLLLKEGIVVHERHYPDSRRHKLWFRLLRKLRIQYTQDPYRHFWKPERSIYGLSLYDLWMFATFRSNRTTPSVERFYTLKKDTTNVNGASHVGTLFEQFTLKGEWKHGLHYKQGPWTSG